MKLIYVRSNSLSFLEFSRSFPVLTTKNMGLPVKLQDAMIDLSGIESGHWNISLVALHLF